MTQKTYPDLPNMKVGLKPVEIAAYVEQIAKVLREICKLRREDIGNFENLKNVTIAGRKVDKIPTAFNDVVQDQDFEGDFNFNAGYEYRLINDSGTLKWARNPHGSISW